MEDETKGVAEGDPTEDGEDGPRIIAVEEPGPTRATNAIQPATTDAEKPTGEDGLPPEAADDEGEAPAE